MNIRQILNCGSLLISFATTTFSQNILINSPGFGPANPINCANYNNGDVVNFFDSGGASGNYAPNENFTLTICPNLPNGPKIGVTMGVNAGFTFNIAPDDTLYIYDGPNTSSPLLGAYNSSNAPNGFSHQASFQNNPSGCLTFVFKSNSTNQQAGWAGNISCGNPPQPFYPHIEAYINGQGSNVLNPLDTGYVDICFGDSILFVSNPDFPYSLENNGFGYSQSNNSVTFAWTSSNGDTGSGNQFWFTPPSRDGFLITLLVTDQFPQTVPMKCKVRVGKLPDFTGAGPLKDTICVNEIIPVFGGANSTDTVGVHFPPGSFVLGGSFGGLLPLPDGSGVAYNTSINLSGFETGATVTSPDDLQSICINMEHSYLGDLEVWLECPSGQTVILFDAYTGLGGQFPGGFAGGNTWLGDANDQGTGTPGIGFDYCFSSSINTWGTMQQELANGNTIPVNSFAPPAGNAMNPNGIYLPQQSFDALIGCPLNGQWTLHVQDNLAQDDGYVFNWSLNFNSNLLPDNEVYQNTLTNHFWQSDPTIVSVQDTMILVGTGTPGSYNYTFVVQDNFGCVYDTTFTVFVKDPIVLNVPNSICHDTLVLSSNTGFEHGAWITVSGPGQPEYINPTDLNPTIVFPESGVYVIAYNDLTCPNGDTAAIQLLKPPYVGIGSDTICIGEPFTIYVAQFGESFDLLWNTGATTPSITITEGGLYSVTATNACGSYTATATITGIQCDFNLPNAFSPNGDNNNDNFTLIIAEGLEAFRIVILNRWGNVIREFNEPGFAWDGTDSSGSEVTEGVYFYKAIGTIFGGREIIKQGFVHLVRE